ncbi:MAG: hypothetical protein COW24_04540 [Candidatus Kerfeldbacteria bacterium CG15_BIG_FIL_POST_REV_8_21_14_020_45_12]|uniref:O-methyltransferase C-terminal domain-containing protein n=1 Tax=Candidatus Kerfeldbacteria bacterium CG15_BIG_FIL_POST_REV_8_21_14_020_45_12 TaxID=2014247 RepID=A0A2M7H2Y4_9BACT|nr:MAG: hypothetical protein COW24_04540 [Candidatus Kerfeldbacteria bacterium CG15_BIG_FIL_POST_REV_8_21_14_020_45_12]PJA93360.1 MAG: hypothetical protein CO132_03315 [Candidatus Kerfeldbacteria bacterium CG_4_9_14_3_um_filter_45_8]
MPSLTFWLHVSILSILVLALVRLNFRLAVIVLGIRPVLPFLPTSRRVTKAIIEDGVLANKNNIVDLGCGTGTMIANLASTYTSASFSGVEHSHLLVWLARLRFLLTRPQVTIKRGDMFAYSVKEADAIIGFWISDFTKKLLPKFEQECKPGTAIVSNRFRLPPSNQFSEKKIIAGRNKIYVYIKK